MMEQEYITLELKIVREMTGIVAHRRLIAISGNISEDFKEDLLNDYSIDVDKLLKDRTNEL
jgi:hydroxymethylglutaryl-CoA reductase